MQRQYRGQVCAPNRKKAMIDKKITFRQALSKVNLGDMWDAKFYVGAGTVIGVTLVGIAYGIESAFEFPPLSDLGDIISSITTWAFGDYPSLSWLVVAAVLLWLPPLRRSRTSCRAGHRDQEGPHAQAGRS